MKKNGDKRNGHVSKNTVKDVCKEREKKNKTEKKKEEKRSKNMKKLTPDRLKLR